MELVASILLAAVFAVFAAGSFIVNTDEKIRKNKKKAEKEPKE
jgi:hypothetical protein